MKRIVDIATSLIGIITLSPILIAVVFAIAILDGFPIIFKQSRVGLHGKPFLIWKFRTMHKNAEKVGSFQTQKDDPRITKLGRLLRRTSIDELPQLFNVLMGDMSIVGPRPNVFAQREYYSETDWNVRHSVKPGITGLAQATLRSNASEAQRLELDLAYVNNCGFYLDLKIVFMTFKQVVTKGGN